VREAIKLHQLGPVEIVSLGGYPAGTVLGRRQFYRGAVARDLCLQREPVTMNSLAEEACHIEMNLLNEPVGKQDQYIAAFGGITCFEIDKGGQVEVSPLAISNADCTTWKIICCCSLPAIRAARPNCLQIRSPSAIQ